jgi:hypothetical protein
MATFSHMLYTAVPKDVLSPGVFNGVFDSNNLSLIACCCFQEDRRHSTEGMCSTVSFDLTNYDLEKVAGIAIHDSD